MLALSTDKAGLRKLSQEGQVIQSPQDAVKDPYILEFTGFKELSTYSENDLETAFNRFVDHQLRVVFDLHVRTDQHALVAAQPR